MLDSMLYPRKQVCRCRLVWRTWWRLRSECFMSCSKCTAFTRRTFYPLDDLVTLRLRVQTWQENTKLRSPVRPPGARASVGEVRQHFAPLVVVVAEGVQRRRQRGVQVEGHRCRRGIEAHGKQVGDETSEVVRRHAVVTGRALSHQPGNNHASIRHMCLQIKRRQQSSMLPA